MSSAAKSDASIDAPASAIGPETIALLTRLTKQVGQVLVGKEEVIELAVASLVAGGHLLLEDVPGVGKTTLAKALAKSVGARFSRIQFTSDLLPADILGVNIFDQTNVDFRFRPGPIFANIVLADEINRTTPRTQSCLLEAMSEASVSIDDKTHPLPQPFFVVATQNPFEAHGTYPLPESQLDRFLTRIAIGYPDPEHEKALLLQRGRVEPVDSLEPVLDLVQLQRIQEAVDDIAMDDSLADYILEVVQKTRESARLAIGVSTRGALSVVRAAKALALVRGRDFVVPEDVKCCFIPTLAHRVTLGAAEGLLGNQRDAAEAIVAALVDEVDVPV